jgi:hypothetical protein
MGSILDGGAGDAADAQVEAAGIASATQLKMFEETKKLLAPFIGMGTEGIDAFSSALPGLTKPINISQQWLEKTPGYQFTLDQGLKSTQNSYAAKGLGASGAAMKGAAEYATGLASNTYQQQFQNEMSQRSQIYNMLMGPVTLGANAASGQASQGMQLGQNLSNIQLGVGNANANAAIGKAQGVNNLIGTGLGLGLMFLGL